MMVFSKNIFNIFIIVFLFSTKNAVAEDKIKKIIIDKPLLNQRLLSPPTEDKREIIKLIPPKSISEQKNIITEKKKEIEDARKAQEERKKRIEKKQKEEIKKARERQERKIKVLKDKQKKQIEAARKEKKIEEEQKKNS